MSEREIEENKEKGTLTSTYNLETIEEIKEKIKDIFEKNPKIIRDNYNFGQELETIEEEDPSVYIENFEILITEFETNLKNLKESLFFSEIFYETVSSLEIKITQMKTIICDLKENFI